MKFKSLSIALLLLFLLCLDTFNGELFSTLSQCCNHGSSRAELNESCVDGGHGSSTPIRRVERHLQAICQSALAICCLRSYRRRMCTAGIQAAKFTPSCIAPNGQTGSEYFKDCCDACKLGIALRSKVAGNDELVCQLSGDSSTNIDLGSPWQDAFRQCCIASFNNGSSIDTNSVPVTKRNSSSYSYNPSHASPLPTSHLTVSNDSNWITGVNECDALPPGEQCDHVCVDTPRGYYCHCRPGYRLQIDGKSCLIGTDRCSLNNPCDQLCEDTGDAIICKCHPGYSLEEDGRSCQDIDECEESFHDCTPEAERCVNTIGSYNCASSRTQSDGQPIKRTSSNSVIGSSAYPVCLPGHEYSQHLGDCQDTDECALGTDTCNHGTQFCMNTIGSYVCVTKQPLVPCPPGHRYDEASNICNDIDECAERRDACNRQREFCVNLLGTYECHPRTGTTCPAGYKYNGALQSCEDVDECVEKLHNCDNQSETCRNVVGAYECDIKCGQGFRYHLIYRVCLDVDECYENLHNCDPNLDVCVNTQGGYDCTSNPTSECKAGYKPEAGGCIDVDECQEELDTCDRFTEICVNDIGLYRCQLIGNITTMKPLTIPICSNGFRYDATDSRGCVDIDECVDGYSNNCSDSGTTCVNTIGGYECRLLTSTTPPAPSVFNCPSGHQYSPSEKTCQDIDECELYLDACNRSMEICLNTPGSYRCWQVQCPNGYLPNLLKRTCEDIDECKEGIHNCGRNQTCVNQRGRFSCTPIVKLETCPPGYRRNLTTSSCHDADECVDGTHVCRVHTERCINDVGGFHCIAINNTLRKKQSRLIPVNIVTIPPTSQIPNGSLKCPRGFEYAKTLNICVDVNECQVGAHSCESTQRCDNTVGSFTCIRLTGCGTGYTLNAHTSHCEDDDECQLGFHNCGPAYQCRNTLGSFRCERKTCPTGTRLVADGSCVNLACGPGMEPGPSGQCTDVNECEAEINPCKTNQRCINLVGRFECQNLINCGGGYQMDESGSRCVDIDECSTATHDCRNNQQCINRAGGYICQCPAGYSLNTAADDCEDVDECVRFAGRACGNNAACRNTPGSYVCDCNDGFHHGENNKTCVDVDECKLFTDVCQHNCINVWGSYLCTCKAGYAQGLDKRTCIDVDECTLFKDRGNLCIGICVNEPGSFSCSCPEGYTLSGDKRTCEDVDECLQNNVCKGPDETCLNTRGSYRCNTLICPPDYIRDINHKNRCKRESTTCHLNDEECIKKPLSYSFNYLTFVSNLPIPPAGHVNLFTMRGPPFSDLSCEFSLELKDARAPSTITQKATRDFFQLRRTAFNQAVVSLVRTIEGPQEIELELIMTLYRGSVLGGTALAQINIFVSPHEF